MFKSWQTCWCQPVFLYTSSVFNRSSQDNHCASPTWSAFAIPMPMSKPSTRRCRDQIPTLSRTGRAIVGQLPAGIPKRVHSTVVELWMCRMWTLHVILIVNFFLLKSAAICFARKHGVIVTFSLNGGIVSFCVVAKNVVGDMPFDRCSRNVNSCPQNHPQIRTIFSHALCEHFRTIAMDIFSNPCASLTVSENRKRMIENREAPMTSTNGHYFTLLSLLQGGLRKLWVWQRQVARECPHHRRNPHSLTV